MSVDPILSELSAAHPAQSQAAVMKDRLPHSISLSTTYRQRIPVSERKIELPLLPHGSLSPLSILLWQAGSKALSLNIEMSLKVLKVTPAPCLPQSHSNILTI